LVNVDSETGVPARKSGGGSDPDQRSSTVKTKTQMTPSLSDAQNNDSIYYTGTASSTLGWDFDNTWTIDASVNDGYPILRSFLSPVIFTKHPDNKIVIEGNAASFSALAELTSGPLLPMYQWQVSSDGGTSWDDIPGANGQTYIIPKTGISDSGNLYRLMATAFGYGVYSTSSYALLTVAPPVTVSGTIIGPEGTLSGATVTYNGGSTTTAEDGTYSFTIASGSSITISSVTLYGYELDPSDQVSNDLGTVTSDIDVDFTMGYDTSVSYTVSGAVTGPAGTLSGAIVTYTGGFATTASNGTYSFSVPSGTDLSITAVTLNGYKLDPSNQVSKNVGPVTSDQSNVDFTMTYDSSVSFTVAGTVTGPTGVLGGVTVTYIGGSTTTASNGTYSISTQSGTSVSINSVTLNGYILNPMTQTPKNLGPITFNQSNVDFTMAYDTSVFFTISGIVTGPSGPIYGATVTHIGGSRTTATDGTYSFTVPSGTDVTITSVALNGYKLGPPTQVSKNLGPITSDRGSVDFTMAYDTSVSFTVSGTVTGPTGVLSGVIVTYTEGSVVSSSDGTYSFTVPSGTDVLITDVTLNGYRINPSGDVPDNLGNVASNRSNVNFTMAYDTSVSFNVSGTVTGPTGKLKGVTVTYSVGSVTTADDGTYSFSVPSGTSVLITSLTLNGYRLDPMGQVSKNLGPVTSNQSNIDFKMGYDTSVSFNVSGTVTGPAGALWGVIITHANGSATTAYNGVYSFYVPSGTDVSITAVTLIGYKLDPLTQTPEDMGPITSNQSSVDFTMTYDTSVSFMISGSVTGPVEALYGATVNYTGGSVVTAMNGTYSFTVPSGTDLSIIGITLNGYKINPSNAVPNNLGIVTSNHSGVNFTLVYDSSVSFTISGKIIGPSGVLGGVNIAYTGGSVTTAANGTYSFSVPSGTDVSITSVTLSGYLLNSLTQTPKNLGHVASNQNNIDFTMSTTYKVSGTVTGPKGPLSGATVTFTGGSTTTSSNGTYSFMASSGMDVSITAVTLNGYVLSPSSQVPKALGYLTSDQNNVNFTMGYNTSVFFIVSGYVSGPAGAVHGATVTFTGGSTTTSPNGTYSFSAPSGTNVSIYSVALNGYNLSTSTPVPYSLGEITSNESSVNFILTYNALSSFTISGTVIGPLGPLSGVNIAYTGGHVTTASNGTYSFSVPSGTSVSVISMTLGGYAPILSSQIPRSLGVVTSNQNNVNFVMSYDTATAYIVSGKVTSGDTILNNVSIEYTITGELPKIAFTNQYGNYAISVPSGCIMQITGVTRSGYEVNGSMPGPFIYSSTADFVMTPQSSDGGSSTSIVIVVAVGALAAVGGAGVMFFIRRR